ncbi:MAG TPA: hypothetical protein VG028_05850 [Terriglobia bacterium]|nr:hypothetical protein [Terriglobia bacterium]
MIADRILTRLTQLPGARALWNRFPVGSVSLRVRYGVFQRPHYAYGVYYAADLAKRLGISAISVIEFGVAGGRGLLALESIAGTVTKYSGVSIDVVGFDGGLGMPEAVDYRDLPYVWGKGFYTMDENKLRSRLSPRTELVIGDVAETVPAWLTGKPKDRAPVGFVAFDLDYYSSTKKALSVFEGSRHELHLPRVYCYFDDIMWPHHACHNPYIGELCAIREFNQSHEMLKLCPIHMLRHMRVHPDAWTEQMYVLHDFKHPFYCKNITPSGVKHTQIQI